AIPTILAALPEAGAANDSVGAGAGATAADLDNLRIELPEAVADAETGVARVADIVRSMKALSHPGRAVRGPVDVNQTLQAALTVCQSEYRLIADVVQELGDIPLVLGNAADLGQTFVTLIVNAADAVGEANAGSPRKGRMRVVTTVDGDWVVAGIEDDGHGIPDAIRERIFEPFFTTKDVGRGTGQGLAIART